MSEAIFNSEPMIHVDAGTLDGLKRRARAAPRGRYRLCLHHSVEDPVQEMIIVCPQDTYFRPHRHPAGKSESYHIIEGSLTVYLFDDDGTVSKRVVLGAAESGKPFLFRLASRVWHLPIPRHGTVVYHETYRGPFHKEEDVEYAPWSPGEDSPADVARYLAGLDAASDGDL